MTGCSWLEKKEMKRYILYGHDTCAIIGSLLNKRKWKNMK